MQHRQREGTRESLRGCRLSRTVPQSQRVTRDGPKSPRRRVRHAAPAAARSIRSSRSGAMHRSRGRCRRRSTRRTTGCRGSGDRTAASRRCRGRVAGPARRTGTGRSAAGSASRRSRAGRIPGPSGSDIRSAANRQTGPRQLELPPKARVLLSAGVYRTTNSSSCSANTAGCAAWYFDSERMPYGDRNSSSSNNRASTRFKRSLRISDNSRYSSSLLSVK